MKQKLKHYSKKGTLVTLALLLLLIACGIMLGTYL